jgi:MFS family permease
MHDVGFTPRSLTPRDLPSEIVANAKAGVAFGWAQRPLRLLMLAWLIQMGFVAWAFYAAQPYLLDLLGSDAIWVAGLVAAGIAGSTILGNQVVTFVSRFCGRRTTLLLAAGAVQTGAAVAVGLASSFWVAVPALLLLTAGLGVSSPVRSAYLHQLVPSERRATVVSFDSMVSGTGGVVGQIGLGALGQARSVATAFVVGGVLTAGALPFLGALRRMGGVQDRIVGTRAGVDSSCAGHGLPAIATVEPQAVDEPVPALAPSR